MIAIIDYGMGNVGSIYNMLKHLGEEAIITDDPCVILSSDKIILPGVGSFDQGIINLKKKGLYEIILEFAREFRKPILGICLGMQLLGNRSEEGELLGLGLIDFDNIRFKPKKEENLKVPHMGWDIVETTQMNDPLLDGIVLNPRYYFVHSFYAKCNKESSTLLTCDYGIKFAAAVKENNIYGVQFHPEKSHHFGMEILKNFAQKVI